MPIRLGSRAHGPSHDSLQAGAAARTRREQDMAARKRQSHKPWRLRARHGPHGWCASCQRVEAAATRRHPLASTMSCPRPPNLRRRVRIDGPGSATSEMRVRAGSNAHLAHILTACRPGSGWCERGSRLNDARPLPGHDRRIRHSRYVTLSIRNSLSAYLLDAREGV